MKETTITIKKQNDLRQRYGSKKNYHLEMWKKTMCHSNIMDSDYCRSNECYECIYNYDEYITDGE